MSSVFSVVRTLLKVFRRLGFANVCSIPAVQEPSNSAQVLIHSVGASFRNSSIG